VSPFLVVAGNLILDDVVYEDGTTSLGQPGGAALFAALGASLWGVPTGIVSVVGDDYPGNILATLNRKGIDLAGVRRTSGTGMRTWLLYEGRRRQVVHHLSSPSHEQMSPSPADLPKAWRASACHLAPMPLTVQSDWLDAMATQPGVLVSLDPFDLVEEESLDSLRMVFDRTDLLLLSEDELLLEAALDRPERCLARLASPLEDVASRLKQIFLKRGARGGMAYDHASQEVREWRPRAAAVIDTTGAGDAFAGGLLAGLLQGRPLQIALRQAVVSASFALDARGADGLLQATPSKCAARSREWFGKGWSA
jgi:sugar/nucleoside kinase (ribokinase family)